MIQIKANDMTDDVLSGNSASLGETNFLFVVTMQQCSWRQRILILREPGILVEDLKKIIWRYQKMF